jgi:hypothetical protein
MENFGFHYFPSDLHVTCPTRRIAPVRVATIQGDEDEIAAFNRACRIIVVMERLFERGRFHASGRTPG